MTGLEKLTAIVGRFLAPRVEGDRIVVPTFSFYPSNAMIKAYVEVAGDYFIVSDGGGAVDTLHGAGGYDVDYHRFLTGLTKRRSLRVTENGWIVSPKVEAPRLTGVITEIVETSRFSAELLLRHFRVSESIDFRRAVDLTIDQRFHGSFTKSAHIVGASNKAHTFDYLINLPDRKSIVIDTVVPDSSSVNAALVSHLDLKNARRSEVRQAIVYDDSADWKSSDLALLAIAAPPIAMSEFLEQMERLAA